MVQHDKVLHKFPLLYFTLLTVFSYLFICADYLITLAALLRDIDWVFDVRTVSTHGHFQVFQYTSSFSLLRFLHPCVLAVSGSRSTTLRLLSPSLPIGVALKVYH